ncbi:hypothetical protein [Larkinella soli]|uniref:hypothetical protein n=1 Tax=Larkinella soli TaxID=1770527 RepID=UPI000FFBAB5E|nr:hypothetical protein [Larkinella soli]
MRSLKISSTRLRRVVLSGGVLIGFACGPGTSDVNEFVSFFMPESSRATVMDQIFHYTPMLYRFDDWYDTDEDTVQTDANVLAWRDYTRGRVDDAEIGSALYQTDNREANGLVRWASSARPEALTYLKLAWQAESLTPKPVNVWEEDTARRDTSTAPLRTLKEEALAGYGKTNDPFLKERYGFQAVKLAVQGKEYQTALRLYDQLIQPLSGKTFISDWALSRHAGAALALGDTARAIYEFAQVFDRCPSRRREAESSLRIYGIRFREKALSFCKNDHEKASVYALCALLPRQDGLPFLKEIVRLDPKYPLIELIMAREINKNEYYFFQETAPIYAYDEKSRADSLRFLDRKQEASDYFSQLGSFALESAENKALGNPAFWYTAAAYMDYLGKDYSSAKSKLEKATALPIDNPVLKQQIALEQMLVLAAETETMTPEAENRLIGYLEQFGSPRNFYINNAFVEVCKQVAQKYGYGRPSAPKAGGWLSGCSRSSEGPDDAATAKGFLLTALTSSQVNRSEVVFDSHTDLYDIEDTTSFVTIGKVIAQAGRPNPDPFLKRLLTLTGFDGNTLNMLYGRRLLADHRYAEAAEAYAKVDPATWKKDPYLTHFGDNPFEVSLKGNRFTSGKPNPFTPQAFARKMAEMEKQAKNASGDQAAGLYYQLGCGAYNLSWHGNSWLLVKARWSGAEPAFNVYNAQAVVQQVQKERFLDSLARDPYYTNSRARAFFEQAMTSAKNPELAAKACFMAARCEQDAFQTWYAIEQVRRNFNTDPGPFDREMELLRKTKYSSFWQMLSRQYAQTQFQRDMIRECATYADYLAGK